MPHAAEIKIGLSDGWGAARRCRNILPEGRLRIGFPRRSCHIPKVAMRPGQLSLHRATNEAGSPEPSWGTQYWAGEERAQQS